MKEIRVLRPVTPVCYIEGIRYNSMAAVMQVSKDAPAKFQVIIPYDPNIVPALVIVDDYEGDSEHDNGLPIVYEVKIKGIPVNTVIHIFEKDVNTGIESFVLEGRVTLVQKKVTAEGTFIVLSGSGSALFIEEVTMQMSDLGKALEIEKTWSADGVASISTVASKIKSMGLRKGLLSVLDDAGNNTDIYHNLIWRLFHLFHRIQIIDNPKALGSFNNARMGTIIDKVLSKIKADVPLLVAFKKVLQIVDYHMISVIAPSFINAKDADESGHVKADPDNEYADIDLDPEGGPKEHLKTNDTVYAPSIFLSPPPRPNVIFPNQYGKMQISSNYAKNSTRGIVNITGRGQLTGGAQSKALIMPEEVSDGITENGKHFISPRERILGIRWSSFSQGRPEAVEELSDGYVRGYMENLYSKVQFAGYKITLTECKYNLKPIIGLPTLILSSDGKHWIAELEAMTVSYKKDRGDVSYTFGLCRPYDVVVPSAPATYWFEHDMFSQDNIGSYIYPRIIGELDETGTGGVVPSDQTSDMSIMAHLFQFEDTSEMSESEIEAEYEKPDAPKRAIDNLFKLWRESPSKGWFSRYYGARKRITKEQWFTDFLKCQHSEDWFIVGNGYTLATNSVTIPWNEEYESRQMTYGDARAQGIEVPDGFPDDAPFGVGTLTVSPEHEFGEKLPLDQEFTGCFVKERQDAILPLAVKAIGAVNAPAQIEQVLADVLSSESSEESLEVIEEESDE